MNNTIKPIATLQSIRIRHNITGLFSKGGTSCHILTKQHWSKKGKVWSAEGHVRSHIGQYIKPWRYNLPDWYKLNCRPLSPDIDPMMVQPGTILDWTVFNETSTLWDTGHTDFVVQQVPALQFYLLNKHLNITDQRQAELLLLP